MTDVARLLPNLLAVPSNIGALEQAIGLRFDEGDVAGNDMGGFTARTVPAGDVLGLSVKYAWDMYHESLAASIDALRAKRVLDFTVRLARGRSLVEGTLRERFGAPRTIAAHRVYGLWLVDEQDGDACALAHYDKLPDWAVATADSGARERFLIELANVTAAEATLDAVRTRLGAPPPATGMVMHATDLAFELVPPIAAIELARILAWPNAIGQSTDVHQSSWRIKLVRSEGAYGPVTVPPIYGRFDVDAQLRSRPTGGTVPGHQGGPVGREQLGPDDLVGHLRLEPTRAS